jgi:transposase-like protein
MSKRAYSAEDKFKILKVYEEGAYSLKEITSKYKVANTTILAWKHNFEKYGIGGLKRASTWKRYSKELKLSAIRDYLSGNYSLREVARKYEIPSDTTLRKWIKKYNSHREIKDTAKGMSLSMTKGRSTTWEDRIQVVLFCIKNGKDYQKAAETYEVSYQQVYQWVKKYENGGDEALKDKRGKNKVEAELSPDEKIKLEMKRLERENERLRAENAFLKKLEEIERRRR